MQLKDTFYMLIASALCLVLTGSTGLCRAETLTRREAIRIALERNPQVLSAGFQWESARARLTQARALPDPELELEYEQLPDGLNLGRYGERNIGVSQTLELPQKWWLRNRAASEEAGAAKLLASGKTELVIRAQVKTAFDRVLYSGMVLDNVRLNLELAVDMMEKARARFKAGDVPRLELVRAEVEQARAQARLTNARRELDSARGELNVLLARDPHDSLALSGKLEYRPFELDENGLRETALRNRPDLAGTRKLLSAGRSNLNLARNSLLPDLNLGLYRQSIREANGTENYWHFRIGLGLPLWAAFRQRGMIREAGAEVGRAEMEVRSLNLTIQLELDRALLELRSAEEQVILYRDRILEEADEAYRAAQRSYSEGKAAYLDLLDARRVLTEVRIEYAGMLFNYRAALADLELAAGTELE